jgi:hypothetical protein
VDIDKYMGELKEKGRKQALERITEANFTATEVERLTGVKPKKPIEALPLDSDDEITASVARLQLKVDGDVQQSEITRLLAEHGPKKSLDE